MKKFEKLKIYFTLVCKRSNCDDEEKFGIHVIVK
jgi:hypothetical protein